MPAPVALAGGVAVGVLATSAVRAVGGRREGWHRTNFRGRDVVLAGLGTALAALAGAALVAAIDEPGGGRRTGIAAVFAGLPAALLGLLDDLHGDTAVKGLGGHLRALARGRLTSGGAKLLGVAAAGLVAGAMLRDGIVDIVLAGGVVAGCANLANLLDLRPGRALKVLLLAAVVVAIGAPMGVAGVAWWLAGACLGVLPADLRERTMLGDAGANGLGAVLGVTAVARSGDGAGVPLLLAAVVAATLLSEVVSYSRIIDAVPPLRWADRLGRLA
jgi:UDP-N-acetylmuramyl pentapeptide phosphotransferase/UDP-N-acetylglucosamine-1-phosphate transferase